MNSERHWRSSGSSPVTPTIRDFMGFEVRIEQARVDLNQLLHTRPVPVLDTQEWHRRLGSEPIGKNGKRLVHS